MFKTNFAKSSHDFTTIVFPLCQEELGGGRIIAAEGNPDEIARILDVDCGIDYLQRLPDGGTRAIAARVQWDIVYESFTVRYGRNGSDNTEYRKRRRDIARDYIYPDTTVQAFLADGQMVAGIIKTKALYEYAEHFLREHDPTIRDNGDGTTFFAAWWGSIQDHDYEMTIIRRAIP
jgi:hypothetical protein